jgi:hypothetical protein
MSSVAVEPVRARGDVKTIGGHPNFRAAYNEKEVLRLAWPA